MKDEKVIRGIVLDTTIKNKFGEMTGEIISLVDEDEAYAAYSEDTKFKHDVDAAVEEIMKLTRYSLNTK